MLPENIRSVQPEDETSEISPEQPENIRSGLIHIPKKDGDRGQSCLLSFYRLLIWGTRNNGH
jgi:hypothetical protein